MNLLSRKSFTLMEMIIVVVISSVLAVAALTSYSTMIRKAELDNTILQLTLLHAANQAYKAKNGRYWPNDGFDHTDINEINTVLGLNLPTDDFTFYYFNGDGTFWTLETHSSSTPMFFVEASNAPISDLNPRCNYSCP